jgi:transaldolase
VPQFIETAEQVQAGLIEAREQGVDLTRWRSVITDMAGRWEDSPAFVTQGAENGVELSPEDLRLAGVAVFQRAQRIFRQRAYPSKMLICSLRTGPIVDGVERCWHLEHTAGADAVFTLPPNFLTALIQRCSSLSFEPHIWDELPAELASKLRRVPYFNDSIEPDGIPVEKFNEIEPLQRTAEEFRAATEKMVAFVREQLEAL